MGVERMGKDFPCNSLTFAIMDAGAQQEDFPQIVPRLTCSP